MITSLGGTRACPLGLAAYPGQDPRCVGRAFSAGINYFFFYGPGHASFVKALAPLVRKRRHEIIITTGSGARRPISLAAARRKILAALGVETLDVFFAEYLNPGDNPEVIFGAGGVLDELQRWKAEGSIRLVGATTHDRQLAKRLVADPRVDLLMHRFNMAHRKAAREVFPYAIKSQTPVVAFTATRWGTLLEAPAEWPGEPPNAAECYRYCLAHPAVKLVLTAPRSIEELKENLQALQSPSMSQRERVHWQRYGDLLYKRAKDGFETQWP
jgi:aryl-alcohol dehydrogenase-like predicted oxidoreductase